MKKFSNTPNKSYIVDGKIIWVSRSIALVAAIVAKFENENYILISQRGPGSTNFPADCPGFWNLTCGYLDWDENGYQAFCREVYEENGLYLPDLIELAINDKWLAQPFYVNTEPAENRQNVSLSYGFYFGCHELPELSTKNSEPEEVLQTKWVKVSEIDNYEFAFCHDRRIKQFLKILGIDE